VSRSESEDTGRPMRGRLFSALPIGGNRKFCYQVSMTGLRSQRGMKKRLYANPLFAVSCGSFLGRP
jgi:hypothetical protein